MGEPGISTGFFYEEDILDGLPLIALADFKWVEIWAGPHKWQGNYLHFNWHDRARVSAVERQLERHQLKVWSVHAPYSSELDLSDPEERYRRAAVAEVRGSMEMAARLKSPFLVFHPSSTEFDMDDEDEKFRRIAALRKSAGELVRTAQSLNITAAVENLLPHVMGGDPKVLLEILNLYAARGLGVCFDTSHANCWRGTNVTSLFRKVARHVDTVHLSDNYHDHDDHFIFGRGTVDWKSFRTVLGRAGYGGVHMCEMHGEAMDGDPLQKLRMIFRKAQEVMCSR